MQISVASTETRGGRSNCLKEIPCLVEMIISPFLWMGDDLIKEIIWNIEPLMRFKMCL
jgi:hypothetical protein